MGTPSCSLKPVRGLDKYMGNSSRSGNGNLSTTLRSYISVVAAGHERGSSPATVAEAAELTDEKLLELIDGRSKVALEALYDRYSGAIYSLAIRMLRDAGAAEEVTQDAFFNVWRRASSYRQDRGKASAWLFSIGHHRVIDEVRKRRRRDQTQVYYDVELIDQPGDESNDPVRFAGLQMQRSLLKKALAKLRIEQREIVVLAYYGGFTHSEIANKLGQPLGTVKTRMRLALKKLRQVLGPQDREWAEHGL
jgi:RNA polymerase sigma-70 factor (ECF subfamily)